jgi:RNA polymerase sigma factor (sigma-70 family)
MFMKEEDRSKKNGLIYESLINSRNKINVTKLDIKVESLELSPRTINCLIGEEIKTLEDLIQVSENYLLRTPKFGQKSLKEIKNILLRLNLNLGTSLNKISETKNIENNLKNSKNLKIDNENRFIIENFDKLSFKINNVGFSLRTINCLNNLAINSLGDLIQLTEKYLLRTPNFGRKSLLEIKKFLKDNNFSLNTKIEWPPENYQYLKDTIKKKDLVISSTTNQIEEVTLSEKKIDIDFILNLIISTLSDREYSIIKKRFWEGKTLEEVGIDYKVTRERIRQIESKAVRKIKKHKSVFKIFLNNHKNEIFNQCRCTPRLVTKKSIDLIKLSYPLNDLDGLIYFSIEVIYTGNYASNYIKKKYDFFEKNFFSLGDGWLKENLIENCNNNTEDLIYFLDKKPLPRQCEATKKNLNLSSNDFDDSFNLAQNRSNYYILDNYICENSNNWSTLSNRYLIKIHKVLFEASPNMFIKNKQIMELVRNDNFLNNCPYSQTIMRTKELMRGKNLIKTSHLFYITGEGVIPLGINQNKIYFDSSTNNTNLNSFEYVDQEKIKDGKISNYISIIERILQEHRALSLTMLSEIYVTKIKQDIKPNQTLRILGILLATHEQFIQIGPGVWSLENISNPTENLVNFILKYKNNYPVDIYAFFKKANENKNISKYSGLNKNFEEQICCKGEGILNENTYQSLLSISNPSNWNANENTKIKFRDKKKISNFFLNIKLTNSFNISSENQIKTYDINNLGISIFYISNREEISLVGLNEFFDYPLLWNTSSFNLVLLSLANIIHVPKNNLEPHKIIKDISIDLKELVLNELIEFGYLSWNRKFGKQILSIMLKNYNDFIKKENWITDNLAFHGKI